MPEDTFGSTLSWLTELVHSNTHSFTLFIHSFTPLAPTRISSPTLPHPLWQGQGSDVTLFVGCLCWLPENKKTAGRNGHWGAGWSLTRCPEMRLASVHSLSEWMIVAWPSTCTCPGAIEWQCSGLALSKCLVTVAVLCRSPICRTNHRGKTQWGWCHSSARNV